MVLPTVGRPFEDAPLSVNLVEGKTQNQAAQITHILTLPIHSDRLQVQAWVGHSVKSATERAR